MSTTRRAQVEEAVVAATEELLAEGVPFAELGIERIATRAGISRTAFYFYFRDRREVLMRVTAGVSEQLFAVAEEWWSGEGDGAEQLVRALRTVLALYEEHAPLLRAVVEASAADEEIARFWRELVSRFVEATRRRIEEEQAAGRVEGALSAGGVAFSLTWMTERSAYQAIVQERDPAELSDALAAVWLRAVYGG